MAYTRITPCKNGKSALAYAMNGKGHNGNEKRYEYLGLVNMVSGVSLNEQMNKYWQRASDRNQTQVWRIVQSFSRNEFDPNNPEHIRRANECGQEFVKEWFPNRQAAVVTQIDGESGLVHNHIILSNVDMVNNKGIDRVQRTHGYISHRSDETLQRMGLELDYGKNEQKKYVWRDDLRARIEKASKEAVDYDSFEDLLDLQGVDVVVKPKNITYTLNDLSKYLDEHEDEPKKPLRTRGKNLGSSYDKEHLEELFKVNKLRQQELAEQQAVSVAPVQDEECLSDDKSTDEIVQDIKDSLETSYFDRKDDLVENPTEETAKSVYEANTSLQDEETEHKRKRTQRAIAQFEDIERADRQLQAGKCSRQFGE